MNTIKQSDVEKKYGVLLEVDLWLQFSLQSHGPVNTGKLH